MKSTTQIIAATAFASLLFAPLANANPGGGPIAFKLINGIAVSITASKIDFGEVIPDGANDAVLTITCDSDRDSSGATTSVNNFDTRVTGAPECGIVKVTAGSSPIVYTLAVTEVTALTDEGNSISPTLVIHPNGRADSPIATVPAGETSTSGGRSIAANAFEVFKVAGSMPIVANQVAGTYEGTYTVTAEVQ